jgi:hypothetical protein
MNRTSLRVCLAVLAAVMCNWLVSFTYGALFAVPVSGPRPYFHVPNWLEPFAYSARFLADLAPGVLLGAIARWRPGTLGFVVGFLSFLALAALPDNLDVVLSATGLDWALTRGICWSVGAIAGTYLSQRWMPNKSLGRTREG